MVQVRLKTLQFHAMKYEINDCIENLVTIAKVSLDIHDS